MARPSRPALPRFFLWLLPLSFALQVATIGAFHQYRTRPGDDNFEFGWEMGRVARSIALGHGFSSPYGGNTGPTAWEPPLYPYLMGGVFKLFGIYTHASAWVLLSINSLFTTLTCLPIFWIAHRTFGERIAVWSAASWALCPYVWYWSVHWIWDTTFTPLVLACLFLLALELQEWPGWRGWALFGALYGVGALANPTMLAFLPFCGLWIWRQRYKRGLSSLGGVVLSSVVFFLVLTPWVVRNYEVFGRFVFLRDDFGLQFRLGNGPYADGMLMAYLQPNLNRLEFEKFQRMGELAYAESCKRLAFDWINAHPGRFARHQPEALLLLLERRSASDQQPRAGGLPHLGFPGDFCAVALGTRARAAPEAARGMAFRGTGADLSHGLLLRVPARPLPSSHRTGVDHPDRVPAIGSTVAIQNLVEERPFRACPELAEGAALSSERRRL